MIAITRPLTSAISQCELTHLQRDPIDVPLAMRQHAAYEECLESLGCRIVRLPADDTLPDAVFVEDTAIVLDEIAVITRPGAESRRREVEAIAPVLQKYRELRSIEMPATLDGGDVLHVGRTLWVGLSGRTSREAVGQLGGLLAPFGYTVKGVPFHACLHLKSAVTAVGGSAILINRDWVDAGQFEGLEPIDVHPSEAAGGNALPVGNRLIYPTAFRRTRERLESRGLDVVALDMSELAKAEGAVTCCSVIVG